jgi:hypothetical protein
MSASTVAGPATATSSASATIPSASWARFVGGPARISFTASNDRDDVVYSSDPDGQYNPGPEENGAGSPAVGHERNGIFF